MGIARGFRAKNTKALRVDMLFELTHLIDALPGLAWTALPDGRAEFLNQRWLEPTGCAAGQTRGTGLDRGHSSGRPRACGQLLAVMRVFRHPGGHGSTDAPP